MNPIPRVKPHQAPALLSYGFRPFFFLGACQAALSMALWLPLFEGEVALPTLFAPRDWHAHEMLFGYVPAVLTGFLPSAAPVRKIRHGDDRIKRSSALPMGRRA
jgi:uncharacterized protein involved in response to NO